jgi:predicted nucleotidyltransferase
VSGSTDVGAVSALRVLAERAATLFARYEDISAVCLLGSVARGDARRDSDVDLLVIARGTIRSSRLMRRLPPSIRDDRLSLLCFSAERWQEEVERGTLFMHHVRLEGEPIYDPDGLLRAGLASVAGRPPDVEGELQRQLGRLRLYRDLTRLNGQHLFALAHLYAIGKATAIARCIELGEPIFVKEHALRSVAAHRPALADAAETIGRLRPFYDLARGRQPDRLPFEPVGAEEEVAQAVAAIERLGSG